ncbi:CHASE3 domain-containing protein [Neolewinella lacunae]|uniref:histidine kinase n=1 Tax=Neolewinella lacunae TaxID=1517758 RepID=A0A923PLA7_9BACT|nr:sensor histidine kinase [Neolewinella lacunae]MBC6993303.1 CHASE3 domain-containing protein [Neolewinella lacunae]MDN3636856.1 CHASE3 domain-containing protein [Neolewinella lacunae]
MIPKIKSEALPDDTLKYLFYLIVALVAILTLVAFSSARTSATMNEVVHTWQVKNELEKLLLEIRKAETSQRGYLLSTDSNYLDPYYAAVASYASVYAGLEELIGDAPEQRRRAAEIDKLTRQKFQEMDHTINMVQEGRTEEALQIFNTDLGQKYMVNIETIAGFLAAEEDNLLAKRTRSSSTWRKVVIGLIALSMVVILISLFGLIGKVRPVFAKLVATQVSLQESNRELAQSLEELAKINQQKDETVRQNRGLIERLKAKKERLNNFAFVASHDLREPLRTVSNYVRLFEEDYGDRLDEDAKQYFAFIHKSTNHMRNLIAGLLAYSRLGTSAAPEEVDLSAALQDTLHVLDSAIEEKGATVSSAPLPTIQGYRMELLLLFQNVLANALKFSPANQPPVIDISCHETEDFVQISVKDNGIGIHPRNQKKIFEMFNRLNAAKSYEGQGIGLAFCQQIVNLHHGNIWVDSELGKGSTFHFTLKKQDYDRDEAEA